MSEPDLKEYRSTTGVDSKYADIASDGHALKDRFGSNEEAKKIEFEAEVIGERVAQWYDDPAAAIREYLSNAETACIRRAKNELLEAGHSVPDSVTAMLEAAREACDYEPVIEVTYNRKPEATRFTIEDNGVGISTDEYLVLKKIGYSTSHMDGERLGQFGMGYMSGFQLCGTEGVFNMRTRSFLTDETYSTANYITNFEYLDGLRDQYGTRFEFPAFCSKAEGIPIRSKVEDFAEGMRVTVLYREMDHSGQEVYNEDYMPRALAADYEDEALVIEFENDFFEAVMSPHTPERRGYVTYNISMPIRRNTGRYGSEPKFSAPWSWDFRGKEENGPIVACESDDSVVGLAPVSDTKYANLPDDRKESFIRRSEVPDDAIIMPTPASSRDSYESGHDAFWQYVSQCLNQAWREEVAERIGALDDFSDFKDMDSRQKHIIVRGYNKFGPGYGQNDPQNVVDHFADELDISITTEIAAKLDKLQEGHLVVSRGTDTPQYKSSTTKKAAWKVIDEVSKTDGEVYMGKTISPKKANIAWALHDDNMVVRVEPEDDESTSECYDRLAKLWGWKKLKDIPNSNLKEKLPNLPDDVAEKYETTSSKDMKQNSSGNRRTSRNPKTKRLKVYCSDRRSHRAFSTMEAETIFDAMDSDDVLRVRHYDMKYIVAFDENQTNRSTAKRSTNRHAGVGVVVAPKYVYKYLTDADNVYTSLDDIKAEQKKDATVTLSGDREVNVTDIPDDELVLVGADRLERHFKGDYSELKEYIEDAYDEKYANVTFLDEGDFDQYSFVDPEGGTILRFGGYSGYGSRFRKDGRHRGENDVIEDILTPDNIDWSHDFMKTINQHGSIKGDADRTMRVVEYLRKHDALPTTDSP